MPSPDITPYVNLTLLDRSPQVIFEQALIDALIKTPEWTPQEGHTETVLLESMALEVAELVFAINRLPAATVEVVLRLFDLAPRLGLPAKATVTFTLSDNLGHTIPLGTRLRLDLGPGRNPVDFLTDAAVVVGAGSFTSAPAAVTATVVGQAAHGMAVGTTVALVDAISYVETVTLATAPSGGTEPESGPDFLDRGMLQLSRLVSTLVLPSHFVAAALDDPLVFRAQAIDNYDPALGNERQTVTITGAPTGGTFTLTFSGQTTAAIAYNATAAVVQAALEALSNIDLGDVFCTGGPLPATAVTVEFRRAYAAQNVAQMTATSSLTGGAAPAVAVTTAQEGGGNLPGSAAGHVTVAVAGPAGATLTVAQRATLAATLDEGAQANLAVHVVDPTITTVPVSVTVHRFATHTDAQVTENVNIVLGAYLNPDEWPWSGTVRRNELIALIDGAEGVDYVTTLTTPAADVALVGVAPLVKLGTVVVTVTAP